MATGDTLYVGTQSPHHIRRYVCEELGIDEGRLRVVSQDMGGGFGYKGKHYPEETILVWAARRLRRPVKWIAGRNESFLSDTQGRDHRTTAELAVTSEGSFQALRVSTVADVGAYVSTFGAAIPGPIYSALLAGVYRTPAVYVEVTGVFSNTVPTDAYRGAGRPEACYVLERLADKAARELGIDRAEIRRRNLIPASAMPYKTPVGPTYDCGNFPQIIGTRTRIVAATLALNQRRQASAGKLRGIGIACFVESSGVAPSKLAGMMGARGGFYESAQVRVNPDGSVTAYLGTHNHGQGHETAFAQILSSRFGIPIERIAIVEGDTAAVPVGTGTFGSRSIAVGGSALHVAAGKIIEKGRLIAAHLLEASPPGHFLRGADFSRSAGPTAGWSFAQVAGAAYVPHNYPHDKLEPGPGRERVLRPAELRLLQRRARLRARGRSRDRRGRGARLLDGRRRRHGDQPAAGRGPDPRRAGAGHRPGAVRAHRLRGRPAAVGLVHGLRRCRAPPTCPTRWASWTRASPAPTTPWAPRAAASRAPSARRPP